MLLAQKSLIQGVKESSGQEQVRGMKVRSSVKKMCEGCKVRYFYCVSATMRWPVEGNSSSSLLRTELEQWSTFDMGCAGTRGYGFEGN